MRINELELKDGKKYREIETNTIYMVKDKELVNEKTNHAISNDFNLYTLLNIASFEEIEDTTAWNRVPYNHKYYSISTSEIVSTCDWNDGMDSIRFETANYFNDLAEAKNVKLTQDLYRMVRRFRDENDKEYDPSRTQTSGRLYKMEYYSDKNEFGIDSCFCIREPFEVYFVDYDVIAKCIETVVKPFLEENEGFRLL